MRRKGSTNKELLTWEWDLLSPWILAGIEEWGRMQTFSEQPSGQIFPKYTATQVEKRCFRFRFCNGYLTET